MKKLFYSFLLLSAVSTTANAQTITNAGMETWKTYSSFFTSLTRPDAWFTSDSVYRILKLASAPTATYTGRVTKSTTVKNSGSASAMLVSASDSLSTLLFNSPIDFDFAAQDGSFTGGTNVSKRILFVNAYTQYNHGTTLDSGSMTVLAYKNGIGAGGADSLVGTGDVIITKSTSFAKISVAIDYDNSIRIPDRLVVIFSTSESDVPLIGTTLYVDDVTISDPTGIETPLVNEASIKAFPNPAINNLHISAAINDELVVDFYNALGQKMMSQKMNKEADINVAALAVGNYTFVVSNIANGHKFFSGIFTKQ